MRFTTMHEMPVKVVEVENESKAIDLAFEYEDEIFKNIKDVYGDSVEFIEFVAVKKE
jgi:hypothetical protein